MAVSGANGGQRSNNNSSSGQKTRSTTKSSHTGSRVEPSHLTEKGRRTKAKKQAAKTANKVRTKGNK